MSAAHQAQFVISGSFDSAKLIAEVNAAMVAVRNITMNRLNQVSAGVGQAMTATSGKAIKESGVEQAMLGTKKNMNKINADIFTAVRRVLLWGVAARTVFNTVESIKDSFRDLIKLNEILVNIQKIRPVGFSVGVVEGNILDLAKEFGVAFQDVGETQRTFFQQGFKMNEVLALTRTQLLGVTAANLTAQQSMEFLIGTMAIFGIQAEKSVEILDKLQNVQANYAVTTQDLVDAVRRVGPVVEELGGDFDNLIGTITALKTVTRKTGEFIGTALRTVYSRMLTITGENALKSLGITVRETAGTFRPLHHIMNEIAKTWKDLGAVERNNLAFALGARRRYTEVISLFNNYNLVLDATRSSSESFGAALLAQEKEATSYTRQIARLREEMKALGIEAAKEAIFSLTGTEDMSSAIKAVGEAFRRFNQNVVTAAKYSSFFLKTISALTSVIIANWAATRLWTLGTALFSDKLPITIALLTKHRVGMVAYNKVMVDSAAVTQTLAARQKTAAKATLAYQRAVGVANVTSKTLLLTLGKIGAILAIAGTAFLVFDKLTKKFSKGPIIDENTFGLDVIEGLPEEFKKNLGSYTRVIEQYRNVGGVQAEQAFRELIDSLAVTGRSLKDLSAQEVIAELNALGVEVEDVSDLLSTMDRVIGFNVLFKGGAGLRIEELKQNLAGVIEEVNQLFNVIGGGLKDADFSQVLSVAFNQRELQQVEKDFSKLSRLVTEQKNIQAKSQLEISLSTDGLRKGHGGLRRTLVDIESSIEKSMEDIRTKLSGSDLIQRLSTQYGILGQSMGESLTDSLMDIIAQQSTTGNIPEFAGKEIGTRLLNAIVSGVESLESELPRLIEGSQYDIGKFLTTSVSDPDMVALQDRLLKSLTKLWDALEEGEKQALAPLVDELRAGRDVFDQASGGVLFFSKNVSNLYKEVIKARVSFGSLDMELNSVMFKVDALGSSYKDLAKTIYSSKIDESLQALARVDNIQLEKDKLERDIRELQDLYRELVASGSKDFAELTKTISRQINTQRENYEELLVDEQRIIRSREGLIQQTQKLISEYNSLAMASNRVTTRSELVGKTIEAISSEFSDSIKQVSSFRKQMQSTVSGMRDIQFAVSFDFESTVERNITRLYDIERKALEKSFSANLKVVDAKKQQLALSLQQEHSLERVTDQSLQRLFEESKINAKTMERFRALEEEEFLLRRQQESAREKLKIEELSEKVMARQQHIASMLSEEYRDLLSFADSFGDSIATSVTEMSELVTMRGGGAKFLENLGESYIAYFRKNLGKLVSDFVMPKLMGNLDQQIEELISQIERDEEKLRYQDFGKILANSIENASEVGAGKMANAIYTAAMRVGSSISSVVQSSAGILNKAQETVISAAVSAPEDIVSRVDVDTSPAEAGLAAFTEKVEEVRSQLWRTPLRLDLDTEGVAQAEDTVRTVYDAFSMLHDETKTKLKEPISASITVEDSEFRELPNRFDEMKSLFSTGLPDLNVNVEAQELPDLGLESIINYADELNNKRIKLDVDLSRILEAEKRIGALVSISDTIDLASTSSQVSSTDLGALEAIKAKFVGLRELIKDPLFISILTRTTWNEADIPKEIDKLKRTRFAIPVDLSVEDVFKWRASIDDNLLGIEESIKNIPEVTLSEAKVNKNYFANLINFYEDAVDYIDRKLNQVMDKEAVIPVNLETSFLESSLDELNRIKAATSEQVNVPISISNYQDTIASFDRIHSYANKLKEDYQNTELGVSVLLNNFEEAEHKLGNLSSVISSLPTINLEFTGVDTVTNSNLSVLEDTFKDADVEANTFFDNVREKALSTFNFLTNNVPELLMKVFVSDAGAYTIDDFIDRYGHIETFVEIDAEPPTGFIEDVDYLKTMSLEGIRIPYSFLGEPLDIQKIIEQVQRSGNPTVGIEFEYTSMGRMREGFEVFKEFSQRPLAVPFRIVGNLDEIQQRMEEFRGIRLEIPATLNVDEVFEWRSAIDGSLKDVQRQINEMPEVTLRTGDFNLSNAIRSLIDIDSIVENVTGALQSYGSSIGAIFNEIPITFNTQQLGSVLQNDIDAAVPSELEIGTVFEVTPESIAGLERNYDNIRSVFSSPLSLDIQIPELDYYISKVDQLRSGIDNETVTISVVPDVEEAIDRLREVETVWSNIKSVYDNRPVSFEVSSPEGVDFHVTTENAEESIRNLDKTYEEVIASINSRGVKLKTEIDSGSQNALDTQNLQVTSSIDTMAASTDRLTAGMRSLEETLGFVGESIVLSSENLGGLDLSGGPGINNMPDRLDLSILDNLRDPLTNIESNTALINKDILEQSLQDNEQRAKALKSQSNQIRAIQTVGMLIGQLIGSTGSPQGASIGASVGGMAGMFISPIGAAVGSAVGGILGGLFGPRAKDRDEVELDSVTFRANTDAVIENTRATINNTQAFLFMQRLINAPSSFTMPAFAGQGGGAPVINVTVNGGSGSTEQNVYDAVSRAYYDSARRIGRRG